MHVAPRHVRRSSTNTPNVEAEQRRLGLSAKLRQQSLIRRQRHRELEQQKSVAAQLEEKASAAQSAEMMLAYMSHEIRNLLFGQQANLDLVADLLQQLESHAADDLGDKEGAKTCADARQLLSDACNCSSSIVRVVNDTLDAKRASQFEFLATECRPCLVEAIVDQCAKTVSHKLETKSELSLEVIKHLPLVEEQDDEESSSGGCSSSGSEREEEEEDDHRRSSSRRRQYYMGDADRVTQVLANLVSNAIKYSDQGTITIASEELPGGLVGYSVTDSGPGIAEDIRPLLFKSAYIQSANNKAGSSKDGTGLGLFLCRAIVVDSLGGTISYEKHPSRGSVFSFVIPMPRCKRSKEGLHRRHHPSPSLCPLIGKSLRHLGGLDDDNDDKQQEEQSLVLLSPMKKRTSSVSFCPTISTSPVSSSDAAATCVFDDDDESGSTPKPTATTLHHQDLRQQRRHRNFAPAGPAASRLRGRRILVVDDSKINRTVISRALSAAGAVVELAEDGLIALKMIKAADSPPGAEFGGGPFEMLWTDIEMPKMGGVELVKELRCLSGYEKTPVVAFSGSVTAHDEAGYLKAGCTAVVQKPCRPAQIVEHVMRHLKEADKQLALPVAAIIATAATTTTTTTIITTAAAIARPPLEPSLPSLSSSFGVIFSSPSSSSSSVAPASTSSSSSSPSSSSSSSSSSPSSSIDDIRNRRRDIAIVSPSESVTDRWSTTQEEQFQRLKDASGLSSASFSLSLLPKSPRPPSSERPRCSSMLVGAGESNDIVFSIGSPRLEPIYESLAGGAHRGEHRHPQQQHQPHEPAAFVPRRLPRVASSPPP